jgi:hypothetical protein
VEMVWHHDKFVKKIRVLVAARQNTLDEKFRCLRDSEKLAPLPCR